MSGKVLVTGASGFVGAHCIAPLLERGFEVHAIEHRSPLPNAEGLVVHHLDLLGGGATEAIVERVRPTHLLHAAWLARPGMALDHADNLLWVERSLELFRAFQRCGGTRIVVTGTCYEYDTEYGYCVEDRTPSRPATLYGTCKNALRGVLEKFCEGREMSFAWARLFYLFGPGEHRSRLMPSVVLSLMAGKTAQCTHGRQVRDYLYVQDAAEALACLLDASHCGTSNVCSGRPVTLRDLMNGARSLIANAPEIEFGSVAPRSEEVPFLVGSPEKMAREFGWSARFPLGEAIAETVRRLETETRCRDDRHG